MPWTAYDAALGNVPHRKLRNL